MIQCADPLGSAKVGWKSWLACALGPVRLGQCAWACALGHKACRDNRSVLYQRVPKLFTELALARGDGRYARILRSLTGVQLLILDDWGPRTAQCRRPS